MDYLNELPNWVVLAAVVGLLIVGNGKAIISKFRPVKNTNLLESLLEVGEYVAIHCTGEERSECLEAFDKLRKVLEKPDAKTL